MSRNSEIEQLTIDRTVTHNKSFFSSKKNTVWLALLLLILVFVSYFLIQVLFHSTKKSLSPVVNNVQADNRINPEIKGNLTAFVTSSTVLEANKNQGNSASTFPDNSVLDASGHIVARRIATVSSIITGKLTQLNIEEGQQVHRTQILAQLDDKQALEEVILIKVPNEVYPEIRDLFILLFEKSGFKKIKIEKSIDFKELYMKKTIQ